MRRYVQGPAHFNRTTYDVVLIDGRLRNACAYAIVPYLHADSVVAWHDFTEENWKLVDEPEYRALASGAFPTSVNIREYAKAAARIFEKVDHVDALAIFRINPTVLRHLQYMAKKKRMT